MARPASLDHAASRAAAVDQRDDVQGSVSREGLILPSKGLWASGIRFRPNSKGSPFTTPRDDWYVTK